MICVFSPTTPAFIAPRVSKSARSEIFRSIANQYGTIIVLGVLPVYRIARKDLFIFLLRKVARVSATTMFRSGKLLSQTIRSKHAL